MKYAFIQRHRRVWPISVQCRVLRVSVAGYHEHLVRRRGEVRRRHLSNEALLVHIRAVYATNRGAYGWPRIWRQLRAQGIRVGKQRVQRLMQQHGIRARGKRRFRIATTDSRHDLPIAPNLLDRNFAAASPTRYGSATLLTSRPTKDGCFWRWSWTCSTARWWAGRWEKTCGVSSSSTPWRWLGFAAIRAARPG